MREISGWEGLVSSAQRLMLQSVFTCKQLLMLPNIGIMDIYWQYGIGSKSPCWTPEECLACLNFTESVLCLASY